MKPFRTAVAVLALSAGFALAQDAKPVEVKFSVVLTPLAQTQPAIRIAPGQPANPAEKFETSHKVVASIDVKSQTQGHTLQTLCLDKDGRVVALVSPPKPFTAPKSGGTSSVHVFDAAGKPVKEW